MTLTLEANKYYRRRDGNKQLVAAVNPTGSNPWAFAVGWDENGVLLRWKEDGWIGATENRMDLLSEWIEPVKHTREVWFNAYKNNALHGYTTRCEADRFDRWGRIACFCRTIEFYEGEGL